MKSFSIIFITRILIFTIQFNCYAQEYDSIRSNPSSDTQYFDNKLYTDTIAIRPGWNWLSLPRLERDNNDPVPAQPILENIDPFPAYLQMLGYPLEENPPHNDITWNGYNWSGNLENIQSTFGYKLNPDHYNGIYHLPMTGTILDPETPITIYHGHENWVGYFLPETQSPFDAIPADVLKNLSFIKGQYWSCLNSDFIAPPPKYNVKSASKWRCECNQGQIEMAYNDMVIMVLGNGEQQAFSWNTAGAGENAINKDAPEYFHFSEQPDYEAIFMNLDSIELPDEIGAFAGDSCIGATTILPDDTTAMICAYTQGFEGEEISFELKYSTKSSRPVIEDYLVFNKDTRINEKRKIKVGEKQQFYLVSFNKNKNITGITSASWVHSLPNPSSDKATITYFIPGESQVQLRLTNILGKEIMRWDPGIQPAGEYQIKFNSSTVPAGCYLISISYGNQLETEKLLIMH